MKKWINYIATSVHAGTNGTFIEKIDELKTHLETYDIAALASLKADGDNLLVAVFKLFNALALTNATADWLDRIRRP